jgi:imidazolonepropionase-like amidohydrolase
MKSLLLNLVLIDGRGKPPVPDAWLVVENGRLIETHAGALPPGRFDATIDFEGRTCLPGLIDLHTHLCWDGSRDPVEVNAREGHDLTLLRMVAHARQTLECGVTTVRDVGCVDDLSLVLTRAIAARAVPGPRLIASGRTLVMTGGHDPFWGLFCDGPWACAAGVRGQAYRGAAVIKVAATGGVYGRAEGEDVGTPELRLEELQAICHEAHRLGLRVASHAVGREGIDNSVEAGCDTIEHGIFASDAALRAMAAGGASSRRPCSSTGPSRRAPPPTMRCERRLPAPASTPTRWRALALWASRSRPVPIPARPARRTPRYSPSCATWSPAGATPPSRSSRRRRGRTRGR